MDTFPNVSIEKNEKTKEAVQKFNNTKHRATEI